MGLFIFFIMVIAEVALAIFSISTKSKKHKVRSIVRIVEGIIFLLFTILAVIQWDLRYYALATLLLIMVIIAVANLLRKKEVKRTYKTKGIIIRTLGMTLLIFIVALPAIIFPQYKLIKPTGKYEVARVLYTYTDTNRIETYTNTGEKRKVNAEFWYPKDAQGTYPLVVFSHGSFGIRESNETLYNELASYGYVVCSIDHPYHSLYTTDVEGNTISVDKGFMKEILSEESHNSKEKSNRYFQKWMKIRTGDINFVIDYILAEADDRASYNVYKLVDKSKIGVIGHSLGGAAALGIGRMRADVKCVISLEAPFMCDIQGVKDDQFVFTDEKYPVPVLNVYSDAIWGRIGDLAQYAKNYDLLEHPNEDVFNVHISGVGHLTLTDMALSSPFLTRMLNGHKSTTDTEYCLKTINKLSLEFFNCYLKDEGKFAPNETY